MRLASYLLLRDGGVDRTAPLLLSAALIHAVEHVLAVAFGKKLCWFESHYRKETARLWKDNTEIHAAPNVRYLFAI